MNNRYVTIRLGGELLHHSLVNGEGCRTTLFVTGCRNNCEDCHNKELQDYNYGKDIPLYTVYNEIMSDLPLIDGVTFSGGEPFDKELELTALGRLLKEKSVNIWSYSGYTFEEILRNPMKANLLSIIDVLVDGKFDKTLTGNGDLLYRGSSNQRIIDVQKSLKQGEIVLYTIK